MQEIIADVGDCTHMRNIQYTENDEKDLHPEDGGVSQTYRRLLYTSRLSQQWSEFLHEDDCCDDLYSIADKERKHAGCQRRPYSGPCAYDEPERAQKIAGCQSGDHSQYHNGISSSGAPVFRAEPFVENESDDKRGYDISDDITTGRTRKDAYAAAESCEYRNAHSSDQYIYHLADGAVLRTQETSCKEHRQSGEVHRYRGEAQRYGNERADGGDSCEQAAEHQICSL